MAEPPRPDGREPLAYESRDVEGPSHPGAKEADSNRHSVAAVVDSCVALCLLLVPGVFLGGMHHVKHELDDRELRLLLLCSFVSLLFGIASMVRLSLARSRREGALLYALAKVCVAIMLVIYGWVVLNLAH